MTRDQEQALRELAELVPLVTAPLEDWHYHLDRAEEHCETPGCEDARLIVAAMRRSEIDAWGLADALKCAITGVADIDNQPSNVVRSRPSRLDANRLAQDPSSYLQAGVYGALPVVARHDFAEGARCLAFGLPTAAAAMLFRSVEGALRGMYQRLAGCEPGMRTWGALEAELKNTYKDGPVADLVFHLAGIRVKYRNPTMHPQETYETPDCEGLFFMVIPTLDVMHKAAYLSGHDTAPPPPEAGVAS
jgi:hypothetical protein